jgi:hypothetical protein
LGYYFMLAPCVACGKPFGFHPDKVPSLRVNGVREPVCQDCVRRASVLRTAKGLPLIVPLPGAYEPAEEDGNESFLDES